MKTLTWQKPGQQNVAQELIKIIINYVAELRICRYIQEYSMDRDIKNIVMDKGYVQNTIFELLSRLGIGYEKLEHSPIITMKEGSEIAYKLGSTSCKNLFLCNKRQEYFMLP